MARPYEGLINRRGNRVPSEGMVALFKQPIQ